MADRAPRRAWWIAGALLVAHLAFALFVNRPGYLTWDAGTYHLMAETFARTGDFIVDNGYDELPSPELVVAQLRTPQGQLVAQYPETYTLLTAPIYRLMGYPGLVFFNALCFLAVQLLLYRLATRLFGRPTLGFAAMAIYGFGTYAWEWSHSSYPHLSSTLFVLLAVYAVAGLVFGDRGAGRSPTPTAWLPAVGAGLATGVAVGLRLDAIFVLPGLVLPLVLASPVRWRALAALPLGMAPGLLFLSLTNQHKFGTANPFSYGLVDRDGFASNLRYYLPAALLGAALAMILVGLRLAMESRPEALARLATRWRTTLAMGGLAVALGVAIAPAKALEIVNGTYQIVVDMRVRPDLPEPALRRSVSGAMLYMDGVKKSLLQSAPWLALLPTALLFTAWRDAERWRLAFLGFVPLSFIGVYGSLAWHGSVGLNLRYLNPVLPFLALLGAWLWMRLPHRPDARRAWTIAAVTCLALAPIVYYTRHGDLRELVQLSLPLALACLLVGLDLLARVTRRTEVVGRWLPRLFLVALGYSAAVLFFHDYAISSKYRNMFTDINEVYVRHVESPAVVFSDNADALWGLLDHHRDVILARPGNDGYGTMPPLTHHHLDAGRRVYLDIPDLKLPDLARFLASAGLTYRLVAETPGSRMLPDGVLLQIESVERLARRPPDASPGRSAKPPTDPPVD